MLPRVLLNESVDCIAIDLSTKILIFAQRLSTAAHVKQYEKRLNCTTADPFLQALHLYSTCIAMVPREDIVSQSFFRDFDEIDQPFEDNELEECVRQAQQLLEDHNSTLLPHQDSPPPRSCS